MRSMGNGGSHKGLKAMDISIMGLSSAATRLETILPQRLQRWMMAHSPFLRTHSSAATALAISWFVINMKACQAIRAVISVIAASELGDNQSATFLTGKYFLTGIFLIITFLVLFSFVFTVHCIDLSKAVLNSRSFFCFRTKDFRENYLLAIRRLSFGRL